MGRNSCKRTFVPCCIAPQALWIIQFDRMPTVHLHRDSSDGTHPCHHPESPCLALGRRDGGEWTWSMYRERGCVDEGEQRGQLNRAPPGDGHGQVKWLVSNYDWHCSDVRFQPFRFSSVKLPLMICLFFLDILSVIVYIEIGVICISFMTNEEWFSLQEMHMSHG